MEIKLNVYADNSSEKPSKTYVVRRILFKTAKELATISDESKDGDPIESTKKMLKAVFPDFKEEDLDFIDPTEFGQVMREMTKAIQGVVADAQKN